MTIVIMNSVHHQGTNTYLAKNLAKSSQLAII